MLTILVDENIDGYAEYLSRFVFSSAWNDISSTLGVRIVRFEEVGLAKGALDVQVWEFCQHKKFYLITDNRNQDMPDSLEFMIRTRNLPTSLPVFTISDIIDSVPNVNMLKRSSQSCSNTPSSLIAFLAPAGFTCLDGKDEQAPLCYPACGMAPFKHTDQSLRG